MAILRVWNEIQCPWCKYIINIKRERIEQREAVSADTKHYICNICLAEQYIKLKALQEREEKNKRKKWRKESRK